jgi:hypothetical protein
MDGINTIVSILSLVVAALASIVAIRQTEVSKEGHLVPALVPLLDEFRSVEFRNKHRYVLERLQQDYDPHKTGFSGLPDEVKDQVIPISHYFDNVGIFIAFGWIDDDLVLSYMGNAINSTWTTLAPYILEERRRREDYDYECFFEHIAGLIRKRPPSEIRRRLRLERQPST